MEGSVSALDWQRLDKVAADRLWLRPLGLLCGQAANEAVAAGLARRLAGADLAFTLVAALGLGSDRRLAAVTAPIGELEGWLAGPGARFAERARERLALLSVPRPPWAGFFLDRPLVVGIVNVTPDSFSDSRASRSRARSAKRAPGPASQPSSSQIGADQRSRQTRGDRAARRVPGKQAKWPQPQPIRGDFVEP